MRTLAGAVLMALAMGATTAMADALTDKAQALVNDGKGAEAYRLLEPAEAQRAGEVDYDYLLGVAALAAGQNTRAVFALERVLAIDPNHVAARAQIARAYLALGEKKTAMQEFETVKKQGVPADVSMTIDRYIAEARRAQDDNVTTLSGYVEATLGHDSNVNVGPNKTTIAIPSFGNLPFRLDDDTRANRDSFASVGAGFNARMPLGNDVSLLAGVAASQRNNFNKDQFDTQSGDANLGISATRDRDVYTLMAQAGVLSVDSNRFRNNVGLTGQWQRNLDARNQVGVFAQYSTLTYPDQDVRDADRWVAGASYAHLYRDGVMAFASAYLVKEKPHDNGVDWLGFDGFGLRAGGRMNFDSQTVLFGNLTWEHRRYDDQDPTFQKRRRDNQYGVAFGATRYLTKEWSVTPQVALTVNNSNTALNDYHREMFSVTVRREF